MSEIINVSEWEVRSVSLQLLLFGNQTTRSDGRMFPGAISRVGSSDARFPLRRRPSISSKHFAPRAIIAAITAANAETVNVIRTAFSLSNLSTVADSSSTRATLAARVDT